jgi:streptomycin 6-kinase
MSLIQFQGENFCKLYEYSLEDKVYMMERIVPADTLYESACREERIKIAGAIFKVLHKPDLPASTFPTYTEWFEAGKEGTKNRKDCEELRQYLESAESMLKDICRKYSRNFLLHGDLHHENILKNENGSYTVIDPKGVAGDPVFDLSRFILDEFRDDLVSEPKEIIIDFVKKLGESVGIPCETLLRCLYIETVIWLFREELANGESFEECEQLITNMKTAYELVNVS